MKTLEDANECSIYDPNQSSSRSMYFWEKLRYWIEKLFNRRKQVGFNRNLKKNQAILPEINEKKMKIELDSQGINDSLDKQKVLFDGKFILDVLLDRPVDYLDDAEAVLSIIDCRNVRGYILEKDLEEIWHLCEKLKGSESANLLIQKLLKSFLPISIEKSYIYKARQFNLVNFNSALQLVCAEAENLDAIVTVNPQDFLHESEKKSANSGSQKQLSILSVSEFLTWLKLTDPPKFQNWYDAHYQELSAIELERTRKRLNDSVTREKLERCIDGRKVDTKMTVAGWTLEHFQIYSSEECHSKATVTLWNPKLNKQISESAFGKGTIEAICEALDLALERAIGVLTSPPRYILNSINLSTTEEGVKSPVRATAIIKCDRSYFRGEYFHIDSLKAAFYSYVKALDLMFQKKSAWGAEQIMLTKISERLRQSSENPNYVSLEDFHQVVEKIELSDRFLEQYVSFDEKSYSRKLIFQNQGLTIYVIGWKPGQIVGKHHHGGSLDAICVLKGRMTHWKFPKIHKSHPDIQALSSFEGFSTIKVAPGLGTYFYPNSPLILLDRWEPHQMGNTSEEDLVTLHFRFGTPPDDENWNNTRIKTSEFH